MKNFIRTN